MMGNLRKPGVTVATMREVSVFDVASLLLRHRQRLLLGALIGAVIGCASALLREKEFQSSASFVPEAGANEGLPASLSALSGAMGFSLAGAAGRQSPEFYVELVLSRPVLERIARDSLDGSAPARRVGAALGAGDPATADGLEEAVDRLRGGIIQTDIRRGLILLNVTTPSPQLSKHIADRLVAYVADFDVDARRAKAGSERKFVEVRLAAAKTDLAAAEGALQNFLQANRQYANSPSLSFDRDRLQRSITMRQEIYTTLAQSFEKARIEEVRNTPVLTVVDHANLPTHAESRHAVALALVGLFIGAIVAAISVFDRDRLYPRSDDLSDVSERRIGRSGNAQPRYPTGTIG